MSKRRSKRILVLDNYDSFTYNLVEIVRQAGYRTDVFLNDQIDVEDVGRYHKILLSPGPGIPDNAGILKEVIRVYGSTKSILGICLGMQGIAESFGAQLFNLPSVLHGVTSTTEIIDSGELLFRDIPSPFQATHYHSWAVIPESMPRDLRITAVDDEGLIMGLRHVDYDIRGVQFHPESIRTPEGPLMIRNWLSTGL